MQRGRRGPSPVRRRSPEHRTQMTIQSQPPRRTTSPSDLPDVVATVDVPLRPDEAYRSFLGDTSSWWPDAYLWTPAAMQVSSRPCCCDFGPLLSEVPGQSAVFLWELGEMHMTDARFPPFSEVEVTFAPTDEQRTRIHVHHRAFSRIGTDGPFIRAALSSRLGWPLILEAFAAHHAFAEPSAAGSPV